MTEIAGGPDLFINKDSTINLTCYVRYAPEPPSTIIWSHNHQVSIFYHPCIVTHLCRFLKIVCCAASETRVRESEIYLNIVTEVGPRTGPTGHQHKHFSCSSQSLKKKSAAVYFHRSGVCIDYRWWRAFVPSNYRARDIYERGRQRWCISARMTRNEIAIKGFACLQWQPVLFAE